MAPFSFGNRWVGIVGLRTPPPPEPLHKMALRLQKKSRTRRIRVRDGLELPVEEVLPSLIRIRQRAAIAGLETRAKECMHVESMIRSGRKPALGPWLRSELLALHAPGRFDSPSPSGRANNAVRDAAKPATPPPTEIVVTDWDEWCPPAPDSALLPPLAEPLSRLLGMLDADADEEAQRWVRWACLHSSYLYESIPESPVSTETLELLATLGHGWMRMALLQRIRTQRGDYESNSEVSAALAAEKLVRRSLGTWVTDNRLAYFGVGEAKSLAAGNRSAAPETVAMQIVGSLSLVTASQAPADGLLELISFELEEPEPDWFTLLQSRITQHLNITRTQAGPDHDKQFTVTITVQRRTASGTASSVKEARRLAARSYVQTFMPDAIPVTGRRRRQTMRPMPFTKALPDHHRACTWVQEAFGVADAGLMSQALIHRSWIHENRALLAQAHQRDYGVLAAEGSEVLTNLVRHHYVLHTLNQSVRVPASAVTSPALPRESVVELFDQLPIAPGILCANKMAISPDIKEDVIQAVVGAAWRTYGDHLLKRQPANFAKWIKSFTPMRDPATLLQEYCARHAKTTYSATFERRGPQHNAEFRATLTFAVDQQVHWRGEWRNSHTAAKQSAADSALDLLLGVPGTDSDNLDADGKTLLRGMLLAELHVCDAQNVNPSKEIASGRLAVDLLASGKFDEYLGWAALRSQLLSGYDTVAAAGLTEYYGAVLTRQRRETIRQWMIGYLPTRGAVQADGAQRLSSWCHGEGSTRLALLEDLLSSINDAGPTDGVLDYVERQAMTVAKAAQLQLESIRDADLHQRTLTLRLSGAELAEALDPIVDVVEIAVGGVSWTRDTQSLSVTVPSIPAAPDVLSQAAFDAVELTATDPWLSHVQLRLRELLALAEQAISGSGGAASVDLDEVVAQERLLLGRKYL